MINLQQNGKSLSYMQQYCLQGEAQYTYFF
jgi:hypothetical protein